MLRRSATHIGAAERWWLYCAEANRKVHVKVVHVGKKFDECASHAFNNFGIAVLADPNSEMIPPTVQYLFWRDIEFHRSKFYESAVKFES